MENQNIQWRPCNPEVALCHNKKSFLIAQVEQCCEMSDVMEAPQNLTFKTWWYQIFHKKKMIYSVSLVSVATVFCFFEIVCLPLGFSAWNDAEKKKTLILDFASPFHAAAVQRNWKSKTQSKNKFRINPANNKSIRITSLQCAVFKTLLRWACQALSAIHISWLRMKNITWHMLICVPTETPLNRLQTSCSTSAVHRLGRCHLSVRTSLYLFARRQTTAGDTLCYNQDLYIPKQLKVRK